jgi:hypothetical protein
MWDEDRFVVEELGQRLHRALCQPLPLLLRDAEQLFGVVARLVASGAVTGSMGGAGTLVGVPAGAVALV